VITALNNKACNIPSLSTYGTITEVTQST